MARISVSVGAVARPPEREPDVRGRPSLALARPGERPGQRFEEAVRIHEPILRRLAARLCRSDADARDLVQDTYERALRAWDRLPEDANVRAWLITILNNLFLDRCRRARRAPRVEGSGPTRTLDVPSPEVTAPEPWANVTGEEVRAAVAQLDDEFRRAYDLHLAGKSYRDIAAELGVPTSTVGTRLLRARLKLKQILLRQIGAAEGEAS